MERRDGGKLIGFFSEHLPVPLLLFGWRVCTILGGRIPPGVINIHRKKNPAPVRKLCPKEGFIENQSELSDIAFGSHKESDLSYSGCEIIAVFNLLRAKGRRANLSELIRDFERKGASLRGGFGVEPCSVYRYVKGLFPEARVYYGRTAERYLKESSKSGFFTGEKAWIVTVQNDRRNLFAMIHTVLVTKKREGYVLHNAGRWRWETSRQENPPGQKKRRYVASEPYPSLSEAVNGISRAPRLLALLEI